MSYNLFPDEKGTESKPWRTVIFHIDRDHCYNLFPDEKGTESTTVLAIAFILPVMCKRYNLFPDEKGTERSTIKDEYHRLAPTFVTTYSPMKRGLKD